MREISLKDVSEIIKLDMIGNNYIINGLNLCNRNSIYDSVLSYVTSIKYIKYIRKNPSIKAVILPYDIYDFMQNEFPNLSFFVSSCPEEKFYELHTYLYNSKDFYDNFDFKKIIGNNCLIHGTAIIEDGVIIGDNVTIGQYSVVKKGTIIENNTIIGGGSVIGSEGFQLITDCYGNNTLIKHVGGCKLEEYVYIGNNTTVCNSLFEDATTIGHHTKIDNLVHIAHNSKIGNNCSLTAGVILSGSTIIKDNVWVAPNSTILNKVVLGNKSFVGIGSVVLKNVKENNRVFGNPAKEI